MAKEIKRLYRLDNCVVAGVCAGIAEYCDIDPVVIRILAVLLTISSFGIAALIYILLWLVTSRRLNMSDSISCDVHLQTGCASSAYGASTTQASLAPQDALQTKQNAGSPSCDDGCMEGAAAYTEQGGQPVDATHYEAVAHVGKIDTEYHDSCDNIGRSVRILVWLGILLLSTGVTALFSVAIDEVYWWQLWPCLVILGGVVIMALPSPHTVSLMDRFSYGIVILVLGLFLLLISVHILSWRTVPVILRHLWPLLIMILGVGIIAYSLKNKLLACAVALCIVAILVAGVAIYAVPGSLEQLTVHMPFMGAWVFDVNPWI